MNCYAERAIGSVCRELLRHVRVADADALQVYLDEYRRYANAEHPIRVSLPMKSRPAGRKPK